MPCFPCSSRRAGDYEGIDEPARPARRPSHYLEKDVVQTSMVKTRSTSRSQSGNEEMITERILEKEIEIEVIEECNEEKSEFDGDTEVTVNVEEKTVEAFKHRIHKRSVVTDRASMWQKLKAGRKKSDSQIPQPLAPHNTGTEHQLQVQFEERVGRMTDPLQRQREWDVEMERRRSWATKKYGRPCLR